MDIQINYLENIINDFESAKNLDELSKFLLDNIRPIIKSEFYYLLLKSNVTNTYELLKSFPPSIEVDEFRKIKFNQNSIIYKECITDQAILKLSQNSSIKIQELKFLVQPTKSILVIPLICNQQAEGLLILARKRKYNFSITDEKKAQLLLKLYSIQLNAHRLQDEIKSKERLTILGQSIINSAHGLKNILNNIDGGVFIVEKGTQKKDLNQVNKGWDILRRNSHRVRDLVLDILLFSRPKEPEYVCTDINSIIHDLYDLFKDRASNSKIEINLKLSSNLKKIFVDPKAVYRCILNLISNAISACEENRSDNIIIETKMMKNKIVISVCDNGIGINQENLFNIFDVFFTTKGSKGTGLGLAVTKKIIEEHKGEIKVDSKVGSGSKFTIILPNNTC